MYPGDAGVPRGIVPTDKDNIAPRVSLAWDPFGDGRVRIGHAGEAYGLRSGLWVDPATGKGLAYFVSAVPDNAAKGTRSAFTAAEEAAIDGR